MRILAHLCGDIEMIQLFRAEGDIYRKLAGLIFSKDPSAVSDSERSQSKVICLGINFTCTT